MKIEVGFPPNIEAIRERFTVPHNAVFTYGDTIYSPVPGAYIDAYLMTHEETHTKQQGDDVEGWWIKYLDDPKFRLSQEVEAYRNQYQHFCRNKKEEWKHNGFLEHLSRDLSGPMYGFVCTLEEAKELICQK